MQALITLASVNFASHDQICGENFLFGFFITLTWEDCFVFGCKMNLDIWVLFASQLK
jgi:hypothetical protein